LVFSFKWAYRLERNIDRFGRDASFRECESLPDAMLPNALGMLKEIGHERAYMRAFEAQRRLMLWGEYYQIQRYIQDVRVAQAQETLYGIPPLDIPQQDRVVLDRRRPVVAQMENGVLKRRFDS
jgi:hypothetical protein